MNVVAQPRRSYLPGLTGLRGLGAVWVLCYHAQYKFDLPVLNTGFLGVDLFFILSGFVLSHAHGNMKLDWAGYGLFLRDRVARIFPLHWAGLGLVLLLLWLYPRLYWSMPERFRPMDLVANLFLVQNWGFTRPATWNGPAWSLSTEWLLSLAFPLFLFGARRVNRPALAALMCAGGLIAFAVFLRVTGNPTTDVQARAGMVRAFVEFGAGCLLYRVYLAGVIVPRWARWGTALLLAAGLSAPERTILAVFAVPLILLLSTEPSGLQRSLSSPVMGFLGKTSYSIYLLHWPLLQVSERMQADLDVHGVLAIAWFVGFLALVLALSALTYDWIEAPARDLLRNGLRPMRARISGRLLQLDTRGHDQGRLQARVRVLELQRSAMELRHGAD